MTTMRRTPRSRPRRRRNISTLCLLSLATTCLIYTNELPRPYLFAAASITQRLTSKYASQSQSNSNNNALVAATTSSSQRQLDQYAADDAYVNEGANYDDDAVNEAMAAREEGVGDDGYLDMADVDFEEVSIMPVSCVNYHNGHMIKFQFFEKSSSLNCHFKNLGTFVVSISHYMRAYFNYQALMYAEDFGLPGDVGFLNCVMLKETANDEYPLYAKIGCQHRDTYTSTKLQVIVYRDKQCSRSYSDDEMKSDGYEINGYFLSNKVSFRPPFYSCQGCNPEEISESFSKRYSAWYDDDYISETGQKQTYEDDAEEEVEGENDADDAAADDANAYDDAAAAAQTDDGSYYQQNDDTYNYAAAYDDANNNDDAADDAAAYDDAAADDGNNHYVNTDDAVYYNYAQHDDDFYAMDDDNRRGLRELEHLDASHSLTARATIKDYESDFQQEMALIHRQLEENANEDGNADDATADAAAWNMCQRVHKYGMWCDGDCQALDTFRVDEWSRSDVFLLVIMCVFMGAMMLLVFAKRVKAYERAAMWGDEPGAPNPGLPPCAMLMLFAIVFTIIVVLAALKFVNETLVFAVVTCILLFIYMLKLTLFESRKQVFLPARSTRNHSLKEPFY
mmetsp:Transcript_27381/g.49367  ORF Transcript_27381/g.49367 Transcript_27381/m.49367 type:complete len:622 (+) Transcript_27381:159-2024(+)